MQNKDQYSKVRSASNSVFSGKKSIQSGSTLTTDRFERQPASSGFNISRDKSPHRNSVFKNAQSGRGSY